MAPILPGQAGVLTSGRFAQFKPVSGPNPVPESGLN